MEETISLQDLFKTIKKRISLIIGLTLLAVIIAGVISYFFITPIYQSSTQILVNQQKVEQQQQYNSQDIQTNLQLINTYNVIIKSPAILSKVIQNLDLDTTPALLTNKITVTSEQNSQVVTISVQDPESFKAVDIANTTAEVFQQEIKTLMNVDNVNILSPAIQPEKPSPVKPNKMLNMAIAGVIGLMLGVGIAFLLEYLDTTIRKEQDVEELLQLPILGLISPFPDNNDVDLMTNVKSRRKKV